MIRFTHRGDFKNTERFLNKSKNYNPREILKRYGERGISALASNTPIDSGLTASSWEYSVTKFGTKWYLSFNNTHVVDGTHIAVILQYGHGTRGGTYVQGRDYVNPAIRPVFDQIAEELWREVSSL